MSKIRPYASIEEAIQKDYIYTKVTDGHSLGLTPVVRENDAQEAVWRARVELLDAIIADMEEDVALYRKYAGQVRSKRENYYRMDAAAKVFGNKVHSLKQARQSLGGGSSLTDIPSKESHEKK